MSREYDLDVVYLAFHEASAEDAPSSSIGTKAFNYLLAHMQPELPCGTLWHTELWVPTQCGSIKPFSTYWGEESGWQSLRFGEGALPSVVQRNVEYYVRDVGNHWLAIPLRGKGIASECKKAADQAIGVPYSYKRYVTAMSFGRWAACCVSGSLRAPAHCATLAARILQRATARRLLLKSTESYSPVQLYISCKERIFGCSETWTLLPTRHTGVDPDAVAEQTRYTLLYGSAEDLASYQRSDLQKGLQLLELEVASSIAEAKGPLADREATRQLGHALVRYMLFC